MSTPVHLRPAEGVTVHMPDGSAFPAEGDRRPLDMFLRRRIADGDLVVVPDGEE